MQELKEIRESKLVKHDETEAKQKVKEGKRFIPLKNGETYSHPAYEKIVTNYGEEKFTVLVKREGLTCVLNPGDGRDLADLEDILDEITGLYGEELEFEKECIRNAKTNLGEAFITGITRNAYPENILNGLTKDGKNFDPDMIKELGFDDPYVENRIQTIASLALGKSKDEIKETVDLSSMLLHVDVFDTKAKKLTKKELERITTYCSSSSHYRLKDEYANDSEWEYDIQDHYRFRSSPHSGTKKRKKPVKQQVFNPDIQKLENEIVERRKEKVGQPTPNYVGILREYINLKFIRAENPSAALPVIMPVHEKEEEHK